jgi:hypothetical protein
MHRWWFGSSFLMAGCFQTVHHPTCEVIDRRPVADDEVTPAGTPAELAALVGLDTELPATWWDGSEGTAQVFVAASGQAEWVEQEHASETTRQFGFGSVTPMIYVACPNQLELPLEADVASVDGRLGVAAEGKAVLPDPEGESMWGPGIPHVNLDADFASSTFPDTDERPADWDRKYAFVNLSYDEVGLLEGSAGWGGSRETEEYSSGMAEYVLRFEGLGQEAPTEVE